jgi:hypothetical protein
MSRQCQLGNLHWQDFHLLGNGGEVKLQFREVFEPFVKNLYPTH